MNAGPSMSEAAGYAEQPAANDGVTAGALLRRAREASGLHVAALAVSLKVPVRKLEALEEDRWDVLPDSVFVRALASSVCRTLKIDPQPVLDRLPQNSPPRLLRVDQGINMPFHSPSDGAPPSLVNQLSKPVFLVVFALLLGALVLIFMPDIRSDVVATTVTVTPQAVVATPLAFNPSMPVVVPVAATSTPATSPGGATPVAVSAALPAAVAASAVRPAAVSIAAPVSSPSPAQAAAVAPVAATPASGIIVFRAKGPSWVEVTDAKGVVGLSKVLASGEVASAAGALPLKVTVGRVDSTEVQVRGKAFDLRKVSKDNVARFEVK